jgi:U4/U6 small nuclear ribonucleoprotein PRP4
VDECKPLTEGCQRVLTVKAHENRCTGADFHPAAAEGMSPDVCAFGSACADGTANLWSLNGKHLRTLKAGAYARPLFGST